MDEANRLMLRRAQRIGRNRIVSAYRTVAFDTLNVLTGIPPSTSWSARQRTCLSGSNMGPC